MSITTNDPTVTVQYDYEPEIEIPAIEPIQTLVFDEFTHHDPIEVLLDLREGFESLPETTATTRLDRVVSNYSLQTIQPVHLEIMGSWRVPTDRYACGRGGNGLNRVVNPKAPDAYRYSDVYSICECGAVVTSVNPNDTDNDSADRHDKSCVPINRWRARHRYWERRRATMLRMLRLGLDTSWIVPRLGYVPNRGGIRNEVTRHGLSTLDERENGRKIIALTAADALDRHPTTKIAPAFGLKQSTMSEWIDRYTDVSPLEKMAQRMRGGDGE